MATTAKEFCTCTDLKCPLHPTNHENGCDPCIKKNLGLKEIPSCFFKKAINDPLITKHGSTFEHFANLINSEGNPAEGKI